MIISTVFLPRILIQPGASDLILCLVFSTTFTYYQAKFAQSTQLNKPDLAMTCIIESAMCKNCSTELGAFPEPLGDSI